MSQRRNVHNRPHHAPGGMLSVRDFAVLLAAVLTATAAGVLTWLAGGHPAAAFIAAGAAFTGGFRLADRLITRHQSSEDKE